MIIWLQNRQIFSCAELADSIRTFLSADTLLLDIETTGLSAARHFIYCIGCSYLSPDKSDSITVQLFFAEKQEQEAELLAALTTLLQTHKRIITFNGNSFDLPFLKKRYEINRINQPFSDTQSVDLYREACHLKNLIQLPDYKQNPLKPFSVVFGKILIPARNWSPSIFYIMKILQKNCSTISFCTIAKMSVECMICSRCFATLIFWAEISRLELQSSHPQIKYTTVTSRCPYLMCFLRKSLLFCLKHPLCSRARRHWSPFRFIMEACGTILQTTKKLLLPTGRTDHHP